MKELIKNSFEEALRTMERFISDPVTAESVEKAAHLISEALQKGNKIMTCGNGGSLCDATHFAEELTGRFRHNRNPLPAIAMNDPAHITCVANDYTYNDVFSKYVEALGNENDILIGFSTSGNSENIVRAAIKAREKGLKVIGMTRKGNNKLSGLSDVLISVEHDGFSDRIQEMHILAVHVIIERVEQILEIHKSVES
ncbi:MAG: D-sedoheptulose 7-phosphate isomerase [Porphyromonadaceae bacterium]|nr:D-sedoheptulose 7-phosphate isomerase [Porphyromonadaceae bacterium]